MLKNSTVILTFSLLGTLIKFGKYDYKERTSLGKIIDPEQRLFIIVQPEYSNCYKRIILPTAFVNHAISSESRPNRNEHYKAYTYWNTMSEFDRLQYHIQKYVNDYNSYSYDYVVLYE
jgi:hypothetical protein